MMKRIISITSILSLFIFSSATGPAHKGMCNISIYKAYTQNVFGKNIGYYVEFKNNSGRTVDALKWKATFYDNFNEQKGVREGSWSSGNFISPMKPKATTMDLENNWVNDATKVRITITKVHFTDGITCD
ncbi:MAG: hypothetical protein RL632_177 [Bacteroidota bacterium]|jgi:hypothetical protein